MEEALSLRGADSCYWKNSIGEQNLHSECVLARAQATAVDGARKYAFLLFLAVLEFEVRASQLPGRCSTMFLELGFFEIGSSELFAPAGFEP
jgi:hypothetical protein